MLSIIQTNPWTDGKLATTTIPIVLVLVRDNSVPCLMIQASFSTFTKKAETFYIRNISHYN